MSGGGGGGQTSTPASQPATSAPAPTQSVKDVWGGRAAPDWVKNTSLGTVHDRTNVGEPKGDQQSTATPTEPVTSVTTPTEPQGQPTQPAVQTPPAVPLTADTLAAALAKVMPQQQAQQPAARPQISEDEIRQQLSIFTASAEDYKSAFGVEPSSPQQLEAYNKHLQSIARQAVTVSQVLLQRALAQQQESIQPFTSAVRAQEAQRQYQTFFHENSDLVGYDSLVEKEYHQALSSGRRFGTPAEARKFIADQTRATLKSIGITPTARSNGTQQSTQTPTRPQTSSRQMTTTSVGGRGGGSATPGKAINTQEAVWGKR